MENGACCTAHIEIAFLLKGVCQNLERQSREYVISQAWNCAARKSLHLKAANHEMSKHSIWHIILHYYPSSIPWAFCEIIRLFIRNLSGRDCSKLLLLSGTYSIVLYCLLLVQIFHQNINIDIKNPKLSSLSHTSLHGRKLLKGSS